MKDSTRKLIEIFRYNELMRVPIERRLFEYECMRRDIQLRIIYAQYNRQQAELEAVFRD